MDREHRSIWVIIVILGGLGIIHLIGIGSDLFSRMQYSDFGNSLSDWVSFLWWLLIGSPGFCALISSGIYAWLHYRHRHLTLWLMALQMTIILVTSTYPLAGGLFLLLAWVILISIIMRSKQKEKEEARDDVLDDLS